VACGIPNYNATASAYASVQAAPGQKGQKDRAEGQGRRTHIAGRRGLRECGFDPRRVGHGAWESRCPARRSLDHALSITRKEFSHVVLACRGTENCQHTAIVRALGFTNDHLYAETPDG
jgi:hypothetical protein